MVSDVPQPRILQPHGTLLTSGISGFSLVIIENTVSLMMHDMI